MPKLYTVITARTEFSYRQIEANSPEQAEELAYQTPPQNWKFSHFGDFEHIETMEAKPCEISI